MAGTVWLCCVGRNWRGLYWKEKIELSGRGGRCFRGRIGFGNENKCVMSFLGWRSERTRWGAFGLARKVGVRNELIKFFYCLYRNAVHVWQNLADKRERNFSAKDVETGKLKYSTGTFRT